ncbi:MAG: bifunctional oligoribonuclease/PAP phosphatase NrnA [Bacteroidales bacterium]|nr:bifunctional oligoribonuclease/PAP phosphatase NrnA [Bacteroidales bacterium]
MPLLKNKNEDFLKLSNLFRTAKQPIIIPHENPDGDAIGSALALYNIFLQLGTQATVLSPNNFPKFLKWMPGANDVVIANRDLDKAKDIISNSDLIIFVDFNEISRMAAISTIIEINKAPIILFDHHPEPITSSEILFHNIKASSTAEVVYEALIKSEFKSLINQQVAECIYVGIMTDTGSFNFNSSQPNTYKIVSHLLNIGINKDEIFDKIYNNFSFDRMRLLGYMLNKKTLVLPELKTAYISLSKEELKEYNHTTGDTEGFVNYPLSIEGIKISAIFIERKNYIKISLRSKGDFYINQIASEFFNGGGHKNAAGGDYKGEMNDAIEIFINAISQRKNEIE